MVVLAQSSTLQMKSLHTALLEQPAAYVSSKFPHQSLTLDLLQLVHTCFLKLGSNPVYFLTLQVHAFSSSANLFPLKTCIINGY